jgi:ABC-type multidrug transport system ATPase subunit
MGIDVARDPIEVKQRIAVVPQQSNLDRSLKVREILTFHAGFSGGFALPRILGCRNVARRGRERSC